MKRFAISWLFLYCASCSNAPPQEELVLVQIHDRNGVAETISAKERLSAYAQKNFLEAQPYKKVARLYRAANESRSVITTYHPNGSIRQLLEARELRANGAYREWHSNGLQKIEASVIEGVADLTPEAQDSWLFDSLATVWNEEGKRIAQIQYDKGSLHGPSLHFYPSGALRTETPYVQGRKEGIAVEYLENGQVLSKSAFWQGFQDGPSYAYWNCQALQSEEIFQQGYLNTGSYWDASGNQVAEVVCGRGCKAVFKDKALVQLIEIRRGLAEGGVKMFGPSGELRALYSLKEGQKHGEEIEYYPGEPLKPKLSLQWDRNALHGIAKTWYDNGQMQSQREYARNRKNGANCAWYRDGSLMLLEEYEEDKLVNGKYYRRQKPDPASTVIGGKGIATLFDEEGILLKKVPYAKGKPAEAE